VVVNKKIKRYVALALSHIEKSFDASGGIDSEDFIDAALAHIKIRNIPSQEEEAKVKKIINEVLSYANDSESALDEFNVSLSGVCSICNQAILYGQDGFRDHSDDKFCCTACYIDGLKKENKFEEICNIMNTLTDYGKVRISNNK